MSQLDLRPLGATATDRRWAAQLMRERWGAEIVVAHGQVYRPATLDGLVAWRGQVRIELVTAHPPAG